MAIYAAVNRHPDHPQPLRQRPEHRRRGLRRPKVEARRIFSSFGPLWFAAPFALLTLRYARAGLALFGCCLLGFLFARDWGRVILLSAPVMYVAAARARRPAPPGDRRRPASWRSTWYAVYMQVHGVESNIVNGPLPSYPIR